METIKTFKAGDTLVEEGTKGSSAYVIISGSAKVVKRAESREIVVATLGNGQVFGEMGLIEDKPRSASVKAASDLKVRVIDRDQFNELLRVNPSTLIPIMKSLFERLRQASEMLAEKTAETYPHMKENQETEIIMEGQTLEAKNVLNGRKLLISKFPFLVGRYSVEDPEYDVFYNNDLAIEEEKPYVISRHHFSINNEGGMLWIADRGSAFGLIVNGVEIGGTSHKTRALLDKDENQVVIGPATSRYIFLLRKPLNPEP